MKIIFNDKPAEVGSTALLDVLSELGIIKNAEEIYGMAVSLNDSIISKSDYQNCKLHENDRLDVFYMMAGGSCER